MMRSASADASGGGQGRMDDADDRDPVERVLSTIGLRVDEARSLLEVGSSRVDLQACKLEYSIVSPK